MESYKQISCTKQSQIVIYESPNSTVTHILDTPGFGDNSGLTTCGIIGNFLHILRESNDGITAVLYCTNAQGRLDESDFQNIMLLQDILGPEILKHIYITVTKANTLEPDVLDAYISDSILDIKELLIERDLSPIAENRILFPLKQEARGRCPFADQNFMNQFQEIIMQEERFQPVLCGFDLKTSAGLSEALKTVNGKIFVKAVVDEKQKEHDVLQRKLISLEKEIESVGSALERMPIEDPKREVQEKKQLDR